MRGSGLGAPVSNGPGLPAGGREEEQQVQEAAVTGGETMGLSICSSLAGRRDPPVKSQGEQGSVGGIDEKGWSQGDAAGR